MSVLRAGAEALEAASKAKLLPRLRRALERAIRGMDRSEVLSEALKQTAGSPAIGETSAEYALRALNQVELPQSNEVGGAIRYAEGALDPKLSPKERGAKLLDHQVPELDPDTRKFFVGDAVVPPRKRSVTERFEDPDNPGGAPRKDISALVQLTGPSFALSFDEVSHAEYLRWRRARYDAAGLIEEQARVVGGIAEALDNSKDIKSKSALFFKALNNNDEAAMKQLSPKEQAAVFGTRQYLEAWIDSRPDLKDELFAKALKRATPGFRESSMKLGSKQLGRELTKDKISVFVRELEADFKSKGVLERAAHLAWKDGDFFYVDKHGVPRRGAFPTELEGIDIAGNPAFKHLAPQIQGREDVVPPLLAAFSGITRRQIYEPAWREMAASTQKLPPRLKNYMKKWLQELRGTPSMADELIDDIVGAAEKKLGFKMSPSPGQKYSMAILGGLYRGALWGNMNYYFANYFGQGFLNVAAKHGPLAAFHGLARHLQHGGAPGVPREALLGGFEAIFGKEIPTQGFGGELGQLKGLRDFRRFLRKTDEFAGPTASEYMNRSIGFHVGLKEALDRYNQANRTSHTIDDILLPKAGGIDETARHNLIFDALLDSENVNYVYGVDGRNPLIAQILGRTVIGHTTQFLSWVPKTAEFVFGPVLKDHDPGILMNYLLLSGWLSRQLANAWGVDFGPMTLFGARYPTRQFSILPTGPTVQALTILMQIPGEDDPIRQKDMWKELARIFEMGVVPGDLQKRRWDNFWRTMQAEGLLTQGPPWELIHEWGPTAAEQPGPVFGPVGGFAPTEQNLVRNMVNILHSETPGRVLGLPMLSDRQERRIQSEIWRSGRLWKFYQMTRVEKLLKIMQMEPGGMESPEFMQAMAEVEEEGIPLGGALREGVLSLALPRLLRTLHNAPPLAKAQYISLLRQKYPEIFDPDYNQDLDFEPRVLYRERPDDVLQGKPSPEPQTLEEMIAR